MKGNNMYTCPMHPEVRQEHPGKCPKCGMALVKADKVKHHNSTQESNGYTKLAIIIGLITLVSFCLGFGDYINGSFNFFKIINYFMAGFFITFSGFKLLDLRGFVEGYKTYDLLAMKFEPYAFIYPFIELFFGLSMIVFPTAKIILLVEIFIMSFSGLGVLLKLAKRERFTCSCLGTFLNVPLTKVTLVEDFGMALLGLILLLAF